MDRATVIATNRAIQRDWVGLMHDLVAVENGITLRARRPVEAARRNLVRFLRRLPARTTDWNVEIIETAVRQSLNTIRTSALKEMTDFFGALPREVILAQAEALLDALPPELIIRIGQNMQRAAARRKRRLTEAKKTTVSIDIASQLPGILEEFFSLLGDDEMSRYLQTDEARAYVGAFQRSMSGRGAKLGRILANTDSMSADEFIAQASKVLGGVSDDIERIARTQTQAISYDTFETLMEYASPAVKWVQHSAIIDSRTCLVCGRLNGRLYRLSDPRLPRLPVHDYCRCAYIPHAGGADDAPELPDYESWLRSQSEDRQLEILGRTRFEHFKAGTRIDQFVNRQNRVIPVKRLRRRRKK